MCKFVKLNGLNPLAGAVYDLLKAQGRYLFDDFSVLKREFGMYRVIELIEKYKPYFWAVLTENGDFMGFVYLYDIIHNGEKPYNACVTVCFKPEYWGGATRCALKKFQKHCFKRLGLKKIKAEIFGGNSLVRRILKDFNFKLEGILEFESVCSGKACNIEIWAIYSRELLANQGF